jgi:hypothetical protein
MKKLTVVCVAAVILYFGLLTYFAAHETVIRELFAFAAGVVVLILMVISAIGLNLFPRDKFYKFVPFLICLFGLPAGFIGAIVLGESIHAANFQNNLPRFTKVVHLIQNGEIKTAKGKVQLPEEFSDLAFDTYAHKNGDAQMVIFITDEAFPLWTDGYVYVSGDITNQTYFLKKYNLHVRINTNWFRLTNE